MTLAVLFFGIFATTQTCLSVDVLEFPKTLYTFPAEFKPAFAALVFNPVAEQYDLAYSSFTGMPTQKDKILRIPSVTTNYLDKGKMASQLITDNIIWPNEVSTVPVEAFGENYYWTSASAFFLPSKDEGSISLVDMTNPDNPGDQIIISSTEVDKKWYYHRVLWEDMDNDGDYDAITARAYGNATNTFEAQLVWFENPGTSPPTPNWKTHIIHEGEEDVFFRTQNLELPDGSTTLVIISTGFFSQALTLTWTTNGDWKNPSSINHRIIDNLGWYFDLQMADLNCDGKVDIVASTWSRPEPEWLGSLVIYEMPDGDWTTETWRRNLISTNFEASHLGSGSGAPGSMTVFWPAKEMQENGQKPHIVLSGDDDGQAYIFSPNSEDPSDWGYKQTTIFRAFGTIGGIAVGDVDDDGYIELFIPAYTTNEFVVMTYKP